MNTNYHTFYCLAWEKRERVRSLKKLGYEIISIEHVTRGKVVILAKERFR